MITFMMSPKHVHNILGHAYFICPNCLDTCYAFYERCICGSAIEKASNVISGGTRGRLNYHKNGWFAMDKLSRERSRELKKIKKGNVRIRRRAGFI